MIAALVMGASIAQAGVITYSFGLSGLQEVPTNASTATGTAIVIVDDVANTVFVSLSFSGLSANATAAHIHCCSVPGVNAPVVINFAGFPGATSGAFLNTFSGVSAANITGINGGLAYINIHNSVFPGGEIRGNILTPEPATFGLLTAALGALASLGWRRRKS